MTDDVQGMDPGSTRPRNRSIVWRALALLAMGGSAIAFSGGVYVSTVLPWRVERLEASMRARVLATRRLIQVGRPPSRLLVVGAHHDDCFPTEFEWMWARVRHSAEDVEVQSREGYMRCLEAVASEAEKPRGWRPPRGGQV